MGFSRDPLLLERPGRSSQSYAQPYSERVSLLELPVGSDVDKKSLPERDAGIRLRVDKKNRPMPEQRPDKALVFAIAPAAWGRNKIQGLRKLHADGRLAAVNKNSGEYYFIQEAYAALFRPPYTHLTMHSKEVFGYFLEDSHCAAWRRK